MDEKAKEPEPGKPDPSLELFGNVVFSYSRRQAIEDGVLVDVTETAKEAGFKWPFAMTAEVWELIEQIPPKFKHEDIQGRLWDVLMMARFAIRSAKQNDDIVFFDVILHHASAEKVQLKLHIGPGECVSYYTPFRSLCRMAI